MPPGPCPRNTRDVAPNQEVSRLHQPFLEGFWQFLAEERVTRSQSWSVSSSRSRRRNCRGPSDHRPLPHVHLALESLVTSFIYSSTVFLRCLPLHLSPFPHQVTFFPLSRPCSAGSLHSLLSIRSDLFIMAGRLIAGVSLLISAAFAVPAPGTTTCEDSVTTTSVSVAGNSATPDGTTYATQASPKPSPYGGVARSHYHSPAFLPHGHGHSLRPGLPQKKTNGASKLGTSQAPHLPPWLGGSPMPHGKPWGGRTAKHSNPYINKDLPNTGVTRHYDFTITEQTIAPDGYQRTGMVVNGAFPGTDHRGKLGRLVRFTDRQPGSFAFFFPTTPSSLMRLSVLLILPLSMRSICLERC